MLLRILAVFRAVFALLPLLGQAAHLERVCEPQGVTCGQACDDSGTGGCAPGCDACLCCRHPRLVALPSAGPAPEPEPSERRFLLVPLPPVEARAADIFHVPRIAAIA